MAENAMSATTELEQKPTQLEIASCPLLFSGLKNNAKLG